MKILAPAKINIGLNVLPRRSDGFHSIESIFYSAPLADELEVEVLSEEGIFIRCGGMELPKENTLSKAYRAFCEVSGVRAGFSVNLAKRIPTCGGLGGGSSDAASLLMAMDSLCGANLSQEEFDAAAGKVGSDVFFFVRSAREGRRAALVSGRGESVRPFEARRLNVLLLLPKAKSSTPEAYALLDQWNEANGHQFALEFSEFEAEFQKSPSLWRFSNSFTRPMCQKFPEIAEAIGDMRGAGANFADMSGSGSSVFGIFEDLAALRSARNALAKKWEVIYNEEI